MIRKKNSFFTFIFSTVFGAGHMYMGFMKQGVSIMTAAAVIIAVGSWTGIGTIFFALPVLWFYSFFDAINKMGMPERVFQTLEDHYLFIPSQDNIQLKRLITKYEKAIAVILILLGGSILCENILDLIAEQLSMADKTGLANFIRSLRWNGSKMLFSLIIIVIGVKMIVGKKKELDIEEERLSKNKLKFYETGINSDQSDNAFVPIHIDETSTKESDMNTSTVNDSPRMITDEKQEATDENA